MSAAVELRQVSKVYGSGPAEVHALREVDLSVQAGELVAVMGPSGSGKSTLLMIAGTLEEPTSGQVVIDERELAGLSRNELARLRRRAIGYVFQDFNLLPGLTAAENVALPLELDGVRVKAARAAALEMLQRLGLAGRATRFPDELSGGESQRVSGEAVMRLLRTACRDGVAGLVVTHDAQLASWADRVVFLRDGRVVDQTTPRPGPESLLAPGAKP
jgi:putative ABC transport system ATP-binding protein